MQESSRLNNLHLDDHISVPTSRCSSHDILIERKRNEHDDQKQVDNSADSTHSLGNLLLIQFTHILALQPSLHEGGTQPSDHGIGGRERDAAEGQRRDERFAIAVECVRDYGAAG